MKAKSNFVFLVFCLSLLVGFLQVYSYFREYFSDSHELVAEAQVLQNKIEHEKLRTALVENQLVDLREEIAKVLPAQKLSVKNTADYRLKELTQALRIPASDKVLDLSSVKMQEGFQHFKEKNYADAAKVFRDVISNYPVSPQVIKAHFLLGESLFQQGNYDECLDVVYQMVSQFPQDEMTGYLLLRNAQILSIRKRTAEAGEIYSLVRARFSSPGLKEQARKLASEI